MPQTNRSQAVRLPKAVAFSLGVREASVLRDGNRRVIVPADASWGDDFFDAPGIAIGREQPPVQEREAFQPFCSTPLSASARCATAPGAARTLQHGG